MLETLEAVENPNAKRGAGFTGKRGTLYFAYGSNMNPEQLRSRGVRPLSATLAKLPDHDIAFFGHSRMWDGAMETVVPFPGRDVWGVVYELSLSSADTLDGWQDAREDGTGAYFHCPMQVVDIEGNSQRVLLYKKDILGVPLPPSTEYLEHIIRGASQNNLPLDYVTRLRGIESKKATFPVPVKSRFNLGLLLAADCTKCESS